MTSSVPTAALHVLLVEDNANDAIIVRDLLVDIPTTQVEVEWITTWEEACTKLALGQQEQYDVCLLNDHLGGCTGLELLQELPAGSRIPIILLTESEDHRADVAAAWTGVCDYLIKEHINALLLERSIRYAIGRRELEQAFQRSEAELRLLIESMPQIVWVTRPDGWHTHFNQRWLDFTGLTLEESLGHGWNPPFHPEDRPRAAEVWQRATSSGEPYEIEYRLRRFDGEYHWMLGRALPLRDHNGAIVKWFGTCTDIHELKQAQEAAQRSEQEQRGLAAQLAAEQARLVQAQRVARIGSWETDLSQLTVIWSDETYRIFELPRDQSPLTHQDFLRWVHPDDRTLVDEALAQSVRQQSPSCIEHRLVMPDGRIKFVEENWQVFLDEQGHPVRALGTCQDVTRRKQAETQRDRFFNLSLEMLAIAGLDGYFKRVNPAFFEVLGYTEAELMAQPFFALVHPEDQAATREAMKALAQGIAVVGFENRYRAKDGSWRWLEWKSASTPEEGLIYAAARDVTSQKEAQASLIQMRDELEVRVVERTQELQQAEAETRTRARQQEAVATLGHQALTGIDIDTLLMDAVALVTATLDVDRATVLQLMPDGESVRMRAASGLDTRRDQPVVSGHTSSHAGYALQSKAPVVVNDLPSETRFEPPAYLLDWGIISGVTVIVGGYERPFGTLAAHSRQKRHFTQDDVNFLQAVANVLAAAIERQSTEDEMRQMNTHLDQLNSQLKKTNEELRIESIQRETVLGALQEVTDFLQQARAEAEHAKEAAERANAAKSEFLSRMSHELRTPLNAILGFGQILEMRASQSRDQEAVGHILRGGQHLLSLINEVLDLARIEGGHLQVSLEPVRLNRLLQEVIDLITPVAARHNVHVSRADQGQNNPAVLADQQRLKQVLLNLLSNAIKYNRPGGNVFLSCTTAAQGSAVAGGTTSPEWARLEVRDDGPGIRREDLPRLFQPFERLHTAQVEVEGTGLGLALCQGMMHAMGGKIGLESDWGRGTTAWVELPLTAFTQEEEVALSLEVPAVAEVEFQRTVLLIEDNLANLHLIEHLLAEQSQIHLLAAMQGQIGLELAQQHRPDLILLDRGLPDLSGDEVLERLQADPATASIPVVIISADAMPSQVERLKAAGIAAYLAKPINVKEFLQTVHELLQIRN